MAAPPSTFSGASCFPWLAQRYPQLVAKDAEYAVKMILDAMTQSLDRVYRLAARDPHGKLAFATKAALDDAGFAEADITPRLGEKPVYLAGFGQNRKAKEIHDPLKARAVVLKDGIGPLLAVVPASERLDVDRLRVQLHRPGLEFLPEDELAQLFFDCEKGAIPPLGPDYRIPTVVDTRLRDVEDVYFKAGDHEDLVHVDQTSFRTLMRGAEFLDIVEQHA